MRTTVTAEQASKARTGSAILALFVALSALDGAFDPYAGSPSPWWNAVPVALAAGALLAVWREPSPRVQGFALLALLLAVVGLAYARWGFNPFSLGLAYVVAGLFAALLLAIVIVVPVATCRALRWPAEGSVPERMLDGNAEIPAELAARLQALEAAGFVRRAARRRDDPMGAETAVFLTHGTDAVTALIWQAQMTAASLEGTVLSPMTEAGARPRMIVTDQPGPSPFPSMPGTKTLSFPDHAADALLDIVRRVFPVASAVGSRRSTSAEEVLSLLGRGSREYLKWLIERGYVRAQPVNGLHRLTLKGSIVALSRLLWPGRSFLRWRARREAAEALAGH